VATLSNLLGRFTRSLTLRARTFSAFEEASPPLTCTNHHVHVGGPIYFNTSLPGNLQATSSPQAKLRACLAGLERFKKVYFVFYSEGSGEPDKQLGAPAMLYCWNWLVQKQTTRCGLYTCSYRTGYFAMELGLVTLPVYIRYQRITRTAVIVTDWYSLLVTPEAGPTTVQKCTLWRMWAFNLHLTERRVRLSFQFLFGHRAIPRNDAVGKILKSAMSNAVTSRVMVTNLVTTARRHHNLLYNRFDSP
jgi:ribonuclease HI